MAMMDYLKILQQIQIGIDLGIQSKLVADGSAWEKQISKQTRYTFNVKSVM